MPKTYTLAEVAEHNSAESLWVVINQHVHDVTAFQNMHPGGPQLLRQSAGKDATDAANAAHGSSRKAKSLMSKYCIGTVEEPNGSAANGKVMSLDDFAAAAESQKMPGKIVSLESLGDDFTAEAVQLPATAAPPKVMALDDLGTDPSAMKDFGGRGMVALEDLGAEAAAPRSKMVALEQLGEETNGKKVVKLEDLGEEPGSSAAAAAGGAAAQPGLWARSSRTGRKRTMDKEEKFQEQAEEVKEEEVDPEEDETKAQVRILLSSWALANQTEEAPEPQEKKGSEGQSEEDSLDDQPVVESQEKKASRWQRMKNLRSSLEWRKPKKDDKKTAGSPGPADEDNVEGQEESVQALLGSKVPTSYAEMFEFNATVMGFGKHKWLAEVNRSFDDIVKNAAKPERLLEETEVLALRIGKTAEGEVQLSMYKSAMLAALRSMLPKTWDPHHETAWNWLWETVDQNLKEILQKPRTWQPELARLMARFSDKQKESMRDEVYVRFFEAAPSGQEFFKQSNTRLHFIAARAMDMTGELFSDPWEMTELISALGLRHVGYGIPTELIQPFAKCFVEVLRENAPGEDAALEGFEWSINLVAKILIRVIQEGSTIVMKAINANSSLQLRKAIGLAPRGERAQWLLCIQVGTQKISPLSWAIESGSIEAARAMIQDLLTIRADRDRYYYGADALFQTHPDIVERLCSDAIQLLFTLLDGLVWRSKRTINSARRVNFYVKHLVVREGKFAGALNAICVSQDVKIISNQVLVLLSDTLWAGVVRRQFVLSKVGFLFSLMVFMLSQAILPKLESADELNVRISVFVGRSINYGFSMLRLLIFHWRRIFKAYRTGAVTKGRCPVPLYLKDEDARMGLALLLLLLGMCCCEPMFYCAYEIPSSGPSEKCAEGQDMMQIYIILSMAAMVLHWLLVINLSVFATKLAAFVLVIREVFGEVGKFMVAIVFILITFSSAIASLRHDVAEFSTLPKAANCLFATTVGIYEGDYREMLHQPALLGAVFMFITVSAILLINLLIAQLNCSYDYVYGDMLGFARLARASLIVDAMVACPPQRFAKFVASLRFDQLLEFDEGDVGLGGGIQIKEPGNLNPTSDDIIQRFGGTSSPEMQWPEEEKEDRYTRIKNLIMLLKKPPVEDKSSSKFSVGTSERNTSKEDTREWEDSTHSHH